MFVGGLMLWLCRGDVVVMSLYCSLNVCDWVHVVEMSW